MNSLPVTEADLQAYVDDLLPHARRAEIDAYLALRPAETERLQAYSRQNTALRARFDPVLDETVPPRLRRAPRTRSWPLQRLAAALLIALAGGATGWVLHGAAPAGALSAQTGPAPGFGSGGLAHRAAIAHAVYSPEVRHPVEVGAEQEAHLVGWLSKRLGSPVHAPRLGTLGYELIGGRLLPGNSGPVAQFMYQDGGGRRLTLYVSAEQAGNKESGFRFAQEGPVSVFYWIDGRFGYALSAGIAKGELARIAALVYEQLQQAS
jgi:anti-sigma factor RsiW